MPKRARPPPMAWNQSFMNKTLFNYHTAGKGTYQWNTVEKAVCLRVAKKAVRNAGFDEVFSQVNGHRFTGSGGDRQLLPPEIRKRVDGQLVKSMRRYPMAWRKSPVVRVAEFRPWANNLILNQGLDYLAGGTITWAGVGTYCVLGTGTSTPAFTDVGLGTEVVRTNNYYAPGCSVVGDNATLTQTITRTYDFPIESSNRNYTELGLSHTGAVGANLSTRALISGGSVTVLIGQQARVVYAVAITLGGNAVSTPTSATGWTAGLQGTSAFCSFGAILSTTLSKLRLATGSTIPSFGTNFTRGTSSESTSSGLNSYVSGTYTRTRWASWSLSGAVGTWRSLTITGAGMDDTWCWVFDNAQTKDGMHTLTITWSMSFGRV